MNTPDNSVAVTICCAVYNHEKYLRKAIEGMIHQITTFKFEILVNDDCSTDNSREILKEYENNYPFLFRVMYQKENQYSQGKKIFFDILAPYAKGKYLAICEGDDCWSDNTKLQTQFEIMEKHKDCVLCTHKVRDIDGEGHLLDNVYPNLTLSEGLYKREDIIKYLFAPMSYLFQTSSYFIRASSIKQFGGNYPSFIRASGVGDVPLTWLLVSEGNIYFIDKEMSMYRRDVSGSWSKKMQSRLFRKQHNKKLLLSLREYNEYTNHKYEDLISQDILKAEFDELRLSDDYTAMKATRYRKYYKDLSLKEKVGYYISMKLPYLRVLFEEIRGLKHG